MDFADGWNFVEWGAISGALVAILTAIFFVYDKLIKPVVKASKAFNQRWDDAANIRQIEAKLNQVVEVLTPSNGDPRTLSDRLDDIGHKAVEAIALSEGTRQMLVDYQREELIERRARQREAQEERRQLNKRLGDMENRQTDMSTRQTRLETKMDLVGDKVDGVMEKLENS